jgi:hypothetical protein
MGFACAKWNFNPVHLQQILALYINGRTRKISNYVLPFRTKSQPGLSSLKLLMYVVCIGHTKSSTQNSLQLLSFLQKFLIFMEPEGWKLYYKQPPPNPDSSKIIADYVLKLQIIILSLILMKNDLHCLEKSIIIYLSTRCDIPGVKNI